MFHILILALVVASCSASPFRPNPAMNSEWLRFKQEFEKFYEAEEEFFRRLVWESNDRYISLHNLQADLKEHTFHLGMNEYGDLTHKEFVTTMNGFQGVKKVQKQPVYKGDDVNRLPLAVDWRKKGYVTPVKNQGECGSCWAFSSTGSLEGQHFKQTGKLVSLSEQNLVDCSGPEGNNGCNGGLMDQAFEYIHDNGGIDTEESYPYEGRVLECRYNKTTTGATDIGYVDVNSGDEHALKKAVATIGPISVAIDAGSMSFRFYSNGVYYNSECSSDQLDHGVLAIGYGVDHNQETLDADYWIVKNSWGPTWGLNGYIKMARNRENNCGIATQASYPNVKMNKI